MTAGASAPIILSIEGATRRFGGLVAVDNVSFEVKDRAIFGVIGPNGAGKSTLFNLITGLHPLSDGAIRYDDHDLTHLAPHLRTRLRIARTFQIVRLFRGLNVLDNVMVGRHTKFLSGFASSALRLAHTLSDERRARAKAHELLQFVGLERLAHHPVQALPHGQQRLIEIARALASEPRLLLLDEPAAGLNPNETASLARLLREINRTGVTILLVEHDMPFVMDLCDRLVVLDHGAKLAEGTPAEIQGDRQVINAYLGRSFASAEH